MGLIMGMIGPNSPSWFDLALNIVEEARKKFHCCAAMPNDTPTLRADTFLHRVYKVLGRAKGLGFRLWALIRVYSL